MHAQRLRRGRLKWAVLALLILPVAAAGAALSFERSPWGYVVELYFRFLVPFVPALGASGIVAEEIEGKTFTFLFARPAPRGAMVAGKLLAWAAPLALAFAASILATWGVSSLLGGGVEFSSLLRVLLASTLGVAAFAALTAFAGTLFTGHPFIAALGYLLSIECLLGLAPFLKLLSVTWHLRALAAVGATPASWFADLTPPPSIPSLEVAPWISVLAVIALAAIAVAGAAAIVARAEYRTDR